MDLAAAKKDDQEADNDIDDDLTDDISFAGRGQLVEAQAMQSWDFATWKECSEHLVANHKVVEIGKLTIESVWNYVV